MNEHADPTVQHLDVRPLLDDDVEPLEAILAALGRVAPGGRLVIDAPFRPVPLEALLAGRGCIVTVEHLGADHWRLEATTPGATE